MKALGDTVLGLLGLVLVVVLALTALVAGCKLIAWVWS